MRPFTTIFQYILTLAFLITGGMKLYRPKEKIIADGGTWAENFTEPFIKLIGIIQILCAIGIIINRYTWVVGVEYTFFVLLASKILLFGASYIHYRRKQYTLLVITMVLLAMAFYI